jgi:hypothetical protein
LRRICERQFSLNAPAPQTPPQRGPPDAQEDMAGWLAPFVIAPAPPLMSRCTAPPHAGQDSIAASDIFWRLSKRAAQSSQRYS